MSIVIIKNNNDDYKKRTEAKLFLAPNQDLVKEIEFLERMRKSTPRYSLGDSLVEFFKDIFDI